MVQRGQRDKRNTFVINLVQTPQGYSLVQGTELLNKASGTVILPSNTIPVSTVQSIVSTKEYKPVFKKSNLVMLKKSSQANDLNINAHPLDTPSCCRRVAHWFDLNTVHPIQCEEVESWLKEQQLTSLSVNNTSFCPKTKLATLNLYRRHRNMIVQLYLSEKDEKPLLTVGRVRQHISYDAYWLMKIHLYLSNLGVINAGMMSLDQEVIDHDYVLKGGEHGQRELLASEYDLSLKIPYGSSGDILQRSKHNENQLLKRVTASLRPYCDYCGIHCGIVWFQHLRVIDTKEIASIMKNVNSKNPPLSQKEYEYILCTHCFCDGNFPLLLTHHDFKKITINDKLQPNRRKRNKKRREKKRNRDGEDEEEEEGNKDTVNEDRNKIEERNKNEEPKKEEKDDDSNEAALSIQKLVAADRVVDHKFTLAQTDYLLQLLRKYREDWGTIHNKMMEKGYCSQVSVEKLIQYFVSLPARGVSKLREEYQEEEFVSANYNCNKATMFDLLAANKLSIASALQREGVQCLVAGNREWKNQLDSFMRATLLKYEGRVEHVSKMESLLREVSSNTQRSCKMIL